MERAVINGFFVLKNTETTEKYIVDLMIKHNLDLFRNPNRDWPGILMSKDSKFIPMKNILVAGDIDDLKSKDIYLLEDVLNKIENCEIGKERLYRE
jgi:hypothetical protein